MMESAKSILVKIVIWVVLAMVIVWILKYPDHAIALVNKGINFITGGSNTIDKLTGN
jgi:hypothetical protein